MVRARSRLPVAIVAAVVVAEAAVLLLRPRDGLIEPAPVRAEAYFSNAEIDRARDFRRPQLALFGARLVLEAGVLVLLVTRPPRRLRGPHRRRVLAGAATGAALAVTLTAVTLPLSAISRERAIDVGLVTQSWPGWAGDVAKATAIEAVFAAGGAALLLVAMRRTRRWWLPASAAVIGFGAITQYVGPVVLDPLFNKFERLPAGETRDDVLELARRADVDIGGVYVVDASRRTTAANAYVTGLGATKRVVLYDTLLRDFDRDEVRLVVAHELGHVHHRDVPRGLLFLALVAPVGLLAAQRLAERFGAREATPSAVPAVALAIALVALPGTMVSNQLSRAVERRADSFSLELTGAPDAFVRFERRIALQNVSDPDPPDWSSWLLGTHPPTIERIGAAVAFERERR